MAKPYRIWEVEYKGKRYVGLVKDIAKELGVEKIVIYLTKRDYKEHIGAYSKCPEKEHIKYINDYPIREIEITDPQGVTRYFNSFREAEMEIPYSFQAMYYKAFKNKGMEGYTIKVKEYGRYIN